LRAYVAMVNQQVVGVAVLRAEYDIEYIRIYFNHHARTEHGHLHHFALNPIFHHFTKYFLKEILRKTHKTSLYYPVLPPFSQSEVSLLNKQREISLAAVSHSTTNSGTLYYMVLYCITYCIILYQSMLYYIIFILYYIIVHYIIVHYIILYILVCIYTLHGDLYE